MVNHYTGDDKTQADFFFDPDLKCFQVIALRSYVPGEQVWTTYGRKSNYEWINDYGFIFPNNPFQKMNLQLPDVPRSDPFFEEKIDILVKRNLTDQYVLTTSYINRLHDLRLINRYI